MAPVGGGMALVGADGSIGIYDGRLRLARRLRADGVGVRGAGQLTHCCEWRGLCGNGCKRYREPRREDGSFQRNFFCESYRQFFSYAYPRLRAAAMELSRRAPR